MRTISSRALVLTNADQVLTLAGPPIPRRRNDLSELGIIEDGAVLIQGDKIERVGPSRDLSRHARRMKAKTIDCRGCVVLPGFVDCHTHLVFAGSRVNDFEQRTRGKTYREIAGLGGGIKLSGRLVSRATEAELVVQAATFLAQFAAHGTTTLEVKSGYGLDMEGELKILKAIRRLGEGTPLELVPTLLAGHALPSEFADRRQDYLNQVSKPLIAAAAQNKLAEFVDCFCDRGAFTLEECRAILAEGVRHHLTPRIHAEQLTYASACRLAIEMGAASADHLDLVKGSDIRALAHSAVVATLLPGSNFHLGMRNFPPARRMIDSGIAVALATDFNPGTCPTLNMQMILSIACSRLRMTPAEAISAATINAAFSLRRSDRLGSLEPGKQADLAVMDVDDYRKIPYYFGWNHCVMTVKQGRIIYSKK